MGHRAVERGENKLNKNGSLLNLKQTMLESIKALDESVPLFFRLKDALISGNNFIGNSSNVIASVIMFLTDYISNRFVNREYNLHRLQARG